LQPLPAIEALAVGKRIMPHSKTTAIKMPGDRTVGVEIVAGTIVRMVGTGLPDAPGNGAPSSPLTLNPWIA